jgi:hypothetical protein
LRLPNDHHQVLENGAPVSIRKPLFSILVNNSIAAGFWARQHDEMGGAVASGRAAAAEVGSGALGYVIFTMAALASVIRSRHTARDSRMSNIDARQTLHTSTIQ